MVGRWRLEDITIKSLDSRHVLVVFVEYGGMPGGGRKFPITLHKDKIDPQTIKAQIKNFLDVKLPG